jgi:hypothetical protein
MLATVIIVVAGVAVPTASGLAALCCCLRRRRREQPWAGLVRGHHDVDRELESAALDARHPAAVESW